MWSGLSAHVTFHQQICELVHSESCAVKTSGYNTGLERVLLDVYVVLLDDKVDLAVALSSESLKLLDVVSLFSDETTGLGLGNKVRNFSVSVGSSKDTCDDFECGGYFAVSACDAENVVNLSMSFSRLLFRPLDRVGHSKAEVVDVVTSEDALDCLQQFYGANNADSGHGAVSYRAADSSCELDSFGPLV